MPRVRKEYQFFRSLFKEHIYLHYFLRMLHGANLSRMSLPGDNGTVTVLLLNESTKRITHAVPYEFRHLGNDRH